MTTPEETAARVLAVLAVMGWPDDRGNTYPDDAAVMPAEAHYRLAEEIVQAVDAATPVQDPAAYARGYAAAVAVLRDDERYERWWTAQEYPPDAQYWRAGPRGHLADYLRIVGPGGVDVTKPAEERRPGYVRRPTDLAAPPRLSTGFLAYFWLRKARRRDEPPDKAPS